MFGHVPQDLLLFAMRELKTFQGLGDLNIFIQKHKLLLIDCINNS